MLARRVKMQLRQWGLHRSHFNKTSFRSADLDGMAIIRNCALRGFPIQVDWRKLGVDSVVKIDRRLLVAGAAEFEAPVQFAPSCGSGVRVIPVGSGGAGEWGKQRREQKIATVHAGNVDCGKLAHLNIMSAPPVPTSSIAARI
jgi:hypothetical protein